MELDPSMALSLELAWFSILHCNVMSDLEGLDNDTKYMYHVDKYHTVYC